MIDLIMFFVFKPFMLYISNGIWTNITIVQNQTSPISGVIQTIKQSASWFFFYMWLAISISIIIMLMATSPPDSYWERFMVGIFVSMVISILFSTDGLISTNIPSIMVILWILSLLGVWFFG